jgi:hypothetical protein
LTQFFRAVVQQNNWRLFIFADEQPTLLWLCHLFLHATAETLGADDGAFVQAAQDDFERGCQ